MAQSTEYEFAQFDESRGGLDAILNWVSEINRRTESLRRYDQHLADPDLSEKLRQHWEEMKLLDLRDLRRLVAARRTGTRLSPRLLP